MDGSAVTTSIPLGDPVPWFGARTIAGATVDLHVEAGRWVVLAFVGRFEDPGTGSALSAILAERGLFDEDRLVVYVVLSEPPPDTRPFIDISSAALGFIDDYDGRIARLYGAENDPRTFVLDPMLCAVANVSWRDPAGHADTVRNVLRSLPDVDESVGVPLIAPVLIVPRVFEFELCDFLVDLYDSFGGADSGFMMTQGDRTATVVNHALKRRNDLAIGDPQVKAVTYDRIARRLAPAIERHFQFQATRMDRTLVCCYEGASRGHFYRHRDNLLPGTRHRRFAVTLGLNNDYEGGGIVFPEFGRRAYRPPVGGAIVFSTGTLHAVQPVTSGRRLVYVPFLYGEADVTTRLADNRHLADSSYRYEGGDDDLLMRLPA